MNKQTQHYKMESQIEKPIPIWRLKIPQKLLISYIILFLEMDNFLFI